MMASNEDSENPGLMENSEMDRILEYLDQPGNIDALLTQIISLDNPDGSGFQDLSSIILQNVGLDISKNSIDEVVEEINEIDENLDDNDDDDNDDDNDDNNDDEIQQQGYVALNECSEDGSEDEEDIVKSDENVNESQIYNTIENSLKGILKAPSDNNQEDLLSENEFIINEELNISNLDEKENENIDVDKIKEIMNSNDMKSIFNKDLKDLNNIDELIKKLVL